MLARALAVVMIGLGVAVLIRTASLGGGGVAYGYLFGVLLLFAGALRLYLSARLRK